MRKDDRRRITYEILIFLGIMLLLFLVLRMWPVVFLFILGIFAAALRMLFLSTKRVEIIRSATPQPISQEAACPKTEQEMLQYACALIQQRITGEVNIRYSGARWVWETPNARKNISEGKPVAIVLNGAGGYRRAVVIISNLQYQGLEFECLDAPAAPENAQSKSAVENAYIPPESERQDDVSLPKLKVNYERLAFEWLDDNLLSLMERCNESSAEKAGYLLISSSDLPVRESWPDIQKQLLANGFSIAMETDEGIKVNLPQ